MSRVLVPILLVTLVTLAHANTEHHHNKHHDNQSPEEIKKIHDNNFWFDSNATVVIQFAVNHTVITGGQPYGGVFTDGNKITVKAGRHGSSEPAAEFNNGISLLNMVATEKILDAEPKDLNFAVFGTLSISFDGGDALICDEFRIGQGHYLFTNNWWLGSKNMLWDGGDLVYTCADKNGKWLSLQFHVEGKSDRITVHQF